jgi:tetrapyrrole methylase family protein/MazG family protein
VLVLSDVKLALLEVLDAEHEVVVLQRLGLADEHVERVALEDLDRVVAPDHLTSVFVDTGDAVIAGELERLWQLTLRLRRPGGCPWDAQQTHHSLARHTLEEAYEVIEAIEALPVDAPGGDVEPMPAAYDKLEDELGDLLFQVMIHSALAIEAGEFTVADVARRVHDKLVFRHPHVFGEVHVDSPDDVVRNWEQIKQREQQHASVVDGLPKVLPALLYVPKLFRKLKVVGLDPAAGAVDTDLDAALERLRVAPRDEVQHAFGAVLGALVAWARAGDLDAEAALRGWAARLEADARSLEAWAEARGSSLVELCETDRAAVDAQWQSLRAG